MPGILRALVPAGIFFEIVFPGKFNLFCLAAYMAMGLIFLGVPEHSFSSMPAAVMALVLVGAGLYIFSVVLLCMAKKALPE